MSRRLFHFRGVPGPTRLWRLVAGRFSEGPRPPSSQSFRVGKVQGSRLGAPEHAKATPPGQGAAVRPGVPPGLVLFRRPPAAPVAVRRQPLRRPGGGPDPGRAGPARPRVHRRPGAGVPGGLRRPAVPPLPDRPATGAACHLLLPDDLDLEAGVVRVRNKPALGWQVKTRRERDVPLVPALAGVLRAHLTGRRTGPAFRRRWTDGRCPLPDLTPAGLAWELERRAAARAATAGGVIRRAERGRLARRLWWNLGAVKADRVRTEFMRVTAAVGLPEHTAPKALRHAFATALQDGRVDPLIRNLLLGHATAGARSAGDRWPCPGKASAPRSMNAFFQSRSRFSPTPSRRAASATENFWSVTIFTARTLNSAE